MMGERPHLDLCPSAHAKFNQMSGSCARRVQRRPPDGSAKCFGCLLVGCRRAATPADPFLVSRRARPRSRPRGHIEQFETAGHCERICCSFALSRAIRLLSIACGGGGTCSRSFGLSRAANYGARSRLWLRSRGLRCVGCSAAKRHSFEASGRRVGQGGLELSLVGRTSLLRPFLASRCRRSTRTWSLEAA